MTDLLQLQTPCLVVDETRLQRNIDRMTTRVRDHGVAFRPHLKTCKSVDIAKKFGNTIAGITVSTLREAVYFFAHGFTDILYAVGVSPDKLTAVAELMRDGADIKIILDNPVTARSVAEFGETAGLAFSVLIEIDCDGTRAGIPTEDGALLTTARILDASPGARLLGIMAHAGGSYACPTTEAIAAHAELERAATARAANRLHEAGLPCDIVSVGSTPTATFAEDLTGVTEVRAGVFVFQDLDQVSLGVCNITDVALTVLTTVIGHKPNHNRLIVDAGGLALSRDRGIAHRTADLGYGLVGEPASAAPIVNLVVDATSQEHGLISGRSTDIDFERYPIGSRLRIYPNHVCMTAAAYDNYVVVDDRNEITAQWPRVNGW
ncbi:MAG: alanine racemase [Alphaproteobacteria bacterium]|nr:alanine racemase [Alphaproteobacteria bacterium]